MYTNFFTPKKIALLSHQSYNKKKRKKVFNMTYNEYVGTIVNSDKNDWVYDDSRQSYLYLPDISIMMKAKDETINEDGEWRHKFEESWTENFTKPDAYVHTIELYYNGMVISDFHTTIVDGGRMCIPYPKRPDMTITKDQYGIGKIINIPYSVNDIYTLDEYLRQAGITVE